MEILQNPGRSINKIRHVRGEITHKNVRSERRVRSDSHHLPCKCLKP